MGKFWTYLAKDIVRSSSEVNVPKENLRHRVACRVYGLTSLAGTTDLATRARRATSACDGSRATTGVACVGTWAIIRLGLSTGGACIRGGLVTITALASSRVTLLMSARHFVRFTVRC